MNKNEVDDITCDGNFVYVDCFLLVFFALFLTAEFVLFSSSILLFFYFLLNKAVSKLIGECKSTGKCQNDLATVLHLTLVPIMMKTYITIATFHIAIRLCSYCCMSRVIGQHNIQVEMLFPWIFTFAIHFSRGGK